MLTGFFSGVSGLYYNQQKLDVTSHNISNADTTAFKRSLAVFTTRKLSPDFPAVDRDVQVRNPEFYGIKRLGVFQDIERAGRIRNTEDPMDLAIVPELKNAFFSVRKPGTNETFYTRNGRMSLGHENPQDLNSPIVLYISDNIALGPDGQPIPIDPNNGDFTINKDGTLFQDEAPSGEVALYRFNKSNDPTVQEGSNLQALRRLGDSLFTIPEEFKNEFNPFRIEVGKNDISRIVKQGAKEHSNVNVFSEMVEMINSTKSSEANRVAMVKQMEGLSKLFELTRR